MGPTLTVAGLASAQVMLTRTLTVMSAADLFSIVVLILTVALSAAIEGVVT